MEKIGLLDLEFLHLCMRCNERFNESDIDKSELSKFGVGKILDQLASLKDRKLIELNEDGSFRITNTAKQILWNNEIPLWVKILRLLKIKSFTDEQISKYLNETSEKILGEIELLRKNGFALMSPLRVEDRLEKMYEILPDGIKEIENIESKENNYTELTSKSPDLKKDILQLMDEVTNHIHESNIEQEKKQTIISKLEQIKDKLEI